MRRVTNRLPPRSNLPERIEGEKTTFEIAPTYAWDIYVPSYRKVRGQDVWIERTEAEIDAYLLKAMAAKELDYLRNVELPALAN
jgi:hypothetical protein